MSAEVSIKENLQAVRQRIAAAALRAGRDPREIRLVAVIKNVPLDKVFQALEAGVTEIGENRVQEAAARSAALRARFPGLTYHLVGHLQRNKVRQALDMFDIIQSVDSERLAAEISRRAVKPVPSLIEVNSSGESSKFGVEPDRTTELVRYVSSLTNIKVVGLMTVGPLAGDREKVRSSFRLVRELRDKIAALGLPGVELKWLSMGMSEDFETAIEAGANLVRIGRAIFEEG